MEIKLTRSPLILYAVAFLLGVGATYIYLEKGNSNLREDLKDSNDLRKETEELVRKMSFRLDSLYSIEDSIEYIFKIVEKEVEVLTQVNGNLTLDAIDLTNLDSIDILTKKEYDYIRNKLRNTYHK